MDIPHRPTSTSAVRNLLQDPGAETSPGLQNQREDVVEPCIPRTSLIHCLLYLHIVSDEIRWCHRCHQPSLATNHDRIDLGSTVGNPEIYYIYRADIYIYIYICM